MRTDRWTDRRLKYLPLVGRKIKYRVNKEIAEERKSREDESKRNNSR